MAIYIIQNNYGRLEAKLPLNPVERILAGNLVWFNEFSIELLARVEPDLFLGLGILAIFHKVHVPFVLTVLFPLGVG